MKRRELLGGLLLAFACTPTERPDHDEEALDPLLPLLPPRKPAAAIDMRFSSRPTLVLVIPEDFDQRRGRGRVFGELLNHGSDADLAPLALYDLVCAPMNELRRRFRELPRRGDPWLVLIDRTPAEPTVQAFEDPELDEMAKEHRPDEHDIDARITRLGILIRATVDADMVERLAELEESLLTPAVAAELKHTTLDGAAPRISLTAAAAGMVYAWGRSRREYESEQWLEERRRTATAALAAAARDRFTRGEAPAGSEWRLGYGCGEFVEGVEEDRGATACGMGRVPKRSARFLSFLLAGAPI